MHSHCEETLYRVLTFHIQNRKYTYTLNYSNKYCNTDYIEFPTWLQTWVCPHAEMAAGRSANVSVALAVSQDDSSLHDLCIVMYYEYYAHMIVILHTVT